MIHLLALLTEGRFEEAVVQAMDADRMVCLSEGSPISIAAQNQSTLKVLITGCGPASLACASDLVKKGFAVTIDSSGTLHQEFQIDSEFDAAFVSSDQLLDLDSLVRIGWPSIQKELHAITKQTREPGSCTYSSAATVILAISAGRKAASLIEKHLSPAINVTYK